MNNSLKFWNEDDRPREKLLLKGAHILSQAELLAIILGSGNRQETALDLSQRILSSVNHRANALGRLSIDQLKQFKGVGEAKAVAIKTAFEWSKRLQTEKTPLRPKIRSSKQVFEQLRLQLGALEHEEFWVIYLNNANRILAQVQLSKGGITGTVVDIRLALRKAIELSAVALILVHNHPSGALKPSEADIRLTKRMDTAAEALDLKVLDHLIITEKAYFSFADQQML